MLASFVRAGETESDTSKTSDTFVLKYIKTNRPVKTYNPEYISADVAFKKSTEVNGGNQTTGLIDIFNDKKRAIPFLWEEKGARLYIDYNRNFDLSDDQNNVFEAIKQDSQKQSFSLDDVVLNPDTSHLRYTLEIVIEHVSNGKKITLYQKSFWLGIIRFGEDVRYMILEDNLDGKFDRRDSIYISRRLSEAKTFNEVVADVKVLLRKSTQTENDEISIKSAPFANMITLGANSFMMSFKIDDSAKYPDIAVKVSPYSIPLANVKIREKNIQRAILIGNNVVIGDNPSDGFMAPPGDYHLGKFLIRSGESASDILCYEKEGVRIKPVDGNVIEDNFIFSGVRVIKSRSELNIKYIQTKPSGEMALDQNPKTSTAIYFSIYQKGEKIFTDKFSFG